MLAQFTKAPDELKRYTLDYSQWLATSEVITAASFIITSSGNDAPADLAVDAYSFSALTSLVFYLRYGIDQNDYDVVVQITTNQNQIKQDLLVYNIRAPQ